MSGRSAPHVRLARSRVHVVLNRQAGRLAAGSSLSHEVEAAANGAALHVTRSLDELESVAAEIARAGADRVVLAGGDGSYMAGVTALERAYAAHAKGGASRHGSLPQVAFAPGGTVSTVARNWGFRGSARGHARRLLRATIEGTASVATRPTLRVRDAEGKANVGFIFGAGLVAKFFEVYDAGPRRGYAAAARIVAHVFVGSFVGSELAHRILAPQPCVLRIDGREQLPRAFSLIAASVVRDLGLHLLVTYRASEETRRFHIVASPLPPRDLGPQLPRVLAGKPLVGTHHVDALAERLELELHGEHPAYVLDGEIFHAQAVTVTAGPLVEVLTA